MGQAGRWAKGSGNAHRNLGTAHEHGKGVLQDYVLAHMWYNIAGLSDDKTAATLGSTDRISIESKMTAAQIAEAQKRAGQCMLKKYKRC